MSCKRLNLSIKLVLCSILNNVLVFNPVIYYESYSGCRLKYITEAIHNNQLKIFMITRFKLSQIVYKCIGKYSLDC